MPTKPKAKKTKTKPAVGNNAHFYPLQLSGIPISLSVARAALANIRGVKRLLMKPGVWVKESYEESNGPTLQYCVIGAKRAVDGKGEHLADTILQQCISGQKLVREDALSDDFKRQFLDKYEEVDLDLLTEKTGFQTFFRDDDVNHVQEFNDNGSTILPDICRFLDHCIAQTQKLILRLQKARDKKAAAAAKSTKATKGKKK